MRKQYRGELREFFETGTEGLLWALYTSETQFITLRAGDQITITSPKGRVIFRGVIEEDRERGWLPYANNPSHGQPSALGFWIHWTQKGWEPDDWARLFVRQKGQRRYRAVLTRTE